MSVWKLPLPLASPLAEVVSWWGLPGWYTSPTSHSPLLTVSTMAHPVLSTLTLLIFTLGANGYFFPSNFHFSSGSDWLNDDDDHSSDFGTHNHGSDLSTHNHGSDIGNEDHGFRYDHSYGNSFGFQHDSFHSRPRYPFVPSQPPPVTPPDHHHPPFYHVVRYQPNQGLPLIIRLPNQQTVILPVRAVYSLPIFLENIIRKIQDYYSVYNVIDTLYLHRNNDTVTVKTTTETPGGATTTATPGNGTSAGEVRNGNSTAGSTTASIETSATTAASTEGSTTEGGTSTEPTTTTPPESTITAAPAE